MKRKFKIHGVKSIWNYLYRKMVNEAGSVDYIARGWALGMLIGCIVPMGLQLLISIPLSFVFKASKIGAGLGTLLTNPLTVWFIYPAQCWLGERLLGGGHDFGTLSTLLADVVENPTLAGLRALGGHLLTAFLLGGVLFALVLTPLTYYGVRAAVTRVRRVRAALRSRKAAAGARSGTGG